MKTVSIALCAVMMTSLSGCNKECKEMTKEVLQPMSAANALIETLQTGGDVASACPSLLNLLNSIPQGAATIRDLAESAFTEDAATCVQWKSGTRWDYHCWSQDGHKTCRGFPVSYQYCIAYTHHTNRDAGYDQAIDLSTHLDLFYESANEMCRQADSGKTDEAYSSSRDLLQYLQEVLQPEASQVYVQACN